MEFPASVASLSANTVGSNDVLRRSVVTYHPNVWGDFFLAHTSEFMEFSIVKKEEHERQKEEIKKLLIQTEDDYTHKLELIDSIQRLGVGYHFEEEINETLRYIHETFPKYDTENKDLRVVALHFRLLRQQGYHVPCDVFSEFIDAEGNIKESIAYDVEGLLSLYEASNYGVLGEEILDKALDSCSSRLESLITETNNDCLSRHVKEALKIPISKTLTRLGARKFISMYEEDESHNENLLKFAMLDFNMVQRLHQNELSHLTRWWKELDFANKLPFARDRLVECYFWIMGVYYEPRHDIARKILTKVIYLASVLDDIYDIYGTLDELTLFTSVVRRWEIGAIDELPTYMRIYLIALFNVYVEMEEEMGKIGKSYAVEYAKEEMKRLAEMYFQEAQWLFSNHKPTMEEYMKVALLSSGYMMMTVNSLAVIEDPITRKEFDWVVSEPPILKSSLIITRLMDDLAGYGSEEKYSAVHLYMNEKGASEEEAFEELHKQVKNSWKNLNKECLEPRSASVPILTTVVNFTRVIIVLYTDEDAYGNSKTKTKDMIKSILVDPI